MSIFFANEELKLYTCNTSEYDDYGRKTTYTYRETIPCDMQPYTPSSSLKEFGKILQDTIEVFIDKDVTVYDTDKIIINDIRYEIVGSVEKWNFGPLAHKRILLQEYRKGEH